MKKVAGKLKLELAQFDELEAFSQFASDLDAATQAQLARGQRLRELLKQPQSTPLPVEDQVAMIYAGTNGFLDEIELKDVRSFVDGLLKFLKNEQSSYGDILRKDYVFSSEVENLLKEGIKEYTSVFTSS